MILEWECSSFYMKKMEFVGPTIEKSRGCNCVCWFAEHGKTYPMADSIDTCWLRISLALAYPIFPTV